MRVHVPPHGQLALESEDILVDLDDAIDRNRTVALVATRPMSAAGWKPMEPGQLLVLRRGAIVHDSHADEQVRRTIVTPRAPASRPASGRIPALLAPPRSSAPELASAPLLRPDPSRRDPSGRTLSVLHETLYRYPDGPVERSSHIFRLRPVHDEQQELLDYQLTVSAGGLQRHYEDVFGNQANSVEIGRSYQELRITARSLVRIRTEPTAALLSPARRVSLPLVWMPWQCQMMLPYLLPPELPETQLNEFYEYALSFAQRQDSDLMQTLLDMNMTIYRDFRYVSGSTTLATTPFDVYCQRRGVCQDFANLMICLARILNIPARYRVGYIHTGVDYENRVQSEASHAWVEMYLPRMGWQGFDPTNGCLAGQDHVRVASGRNYVDAAPTTGTIYKGRGKETLAVTVRVEEAAAADMRW
jgi:transglutaminase-like putative cysteine protease